MNFYKYKRPSNDLLTDLSYVRDYFGFGYTVLESRTRWLTYVYLSSEEGK